MTNLIAQLTDAQYVECMVAAGWVEAIEIAEETPTHVTTITIEWSESPNFEDGQVFSTVKEFEALVRSTAAEIGFNRGYDKTKYQVTWSDGEVATYRTDIGDDYTHTYDFYGERKQYRVYLLANPGSMKAYGEDEQTLRDTLVSLEKAEVYQRQIEA